MAKLCSDIMDKPAQKKKSPVGKGMSDTVNRELILTRYAAVGSYNAVAKEFDIYPQQVKRLWEKLSDDEREYYRTAEAEVREKVREKVAEVQAEIIGDTAARVRTSLDKALSALEGRLDAEEVKKMSDKELINCVRLLYNIDQGVPAGDDEGAGKGKSLFDLMDESVRGSGLDITIKSHDDGK